LDEGNLTDIKRIINVPGKGIGKVTVLKNFAGEKEKLPAKAKESADKFFALLKRIKEKISEEKPSEINKFIIQKTVLKKN
jgi:hypothetical protein